MDPNSALEYINAAKGTNYTLTAQFSGGEHAFRVTNTDGARAVLKTSNNPMWKAQIERAKAATGHLRPLGYPVPAYYYIDATDRGTFWLEDELPGLATEKPTPEQVTALINLIELQKGKAISEVQGQDWGWYIQSAVFKGEGSLVRMLMLFGPETSSLAAQIEGMVMGLDNLMLEKGDLVHGDFTIDQVLTQGQNISAVLDWDQVGYGDRLIDLVGLWFSLADQPEASAQIMNHMLQVSKPETIKVYAAYKMLALLAWQINKAGGDIAGTVARTRTALAQLLAMGAAPPAPPAPPPAPPAPAAPPAPPAPAAPPFAPAPSAPPAPPTSAVPTPASTPPAGPLPAA